jgi:hypothetical protein
MRSFAPSIIIGAILTCVSTTSEAIHWSMIAGSCTPDPQYIRNGTFYYGGGAVVVNEDSSAVFNCPITAQLPFTPVQLRIVSSGAAAAPRAETIAVLIEVSQTTGFETEITRVTATSGGPAHPTDSPIFNHFFDVGSNFYYVRVSMTSGSLPGQIQVLHGLTLFP